MKHSSLRTLSRDATLWRSALPWALSLFVAANVGVAIMAASFRAERQANLLARSSSSGAPEGTRAARFDLSVGEKLDSYWPAIPDARRQPLIILSGMSQMYMINDATSKDRTISELLDDALSPGGSRVFGLAAPNLCNEEELLLLLAATEYEPTRPAAWIYGLCFDKFRNVDLRPGYQRFLRGRPELLRRWRQVAETVASRYPTASEKMMDTLRTLDAANSQDPDTFESKLRGAVGRAVPVVAERADLNVRLQLGTYFLRNWVFGIKPTSKRPLIPYRYELNQEFLGVIADEAAAHHVALLLYVIPLNPQSDNPYVPEEYAAFKQWASAFCQSRGIPFGNFEDAVPAEYWGEFNGGPDFKHFRGEGHRLTAQSILGRFATELPGAGPAAATR